MPGWKWSHVKLNVDFHKAIVLFIISLSENKYPVWYLESISSHSIWTRVSIVYGNTLKSCFVTITKPGYQLNYICSILFDLMFVIPNTMQHCAPLIIVKIFESNSMCPSHILHKHIWCYSHVITKKKCLPYLFCWQ